MTLEMMETHFYSYKLSGFNSTFDTVWCAWVSFKGNSILKHHGTLQVRVKEKENSLPFAVCAASLAAPH